MQGIYKKLVYHFYLEEGFEENIANIVHFRCLEKYSNIFNESIIVISPKEPQNEALINKAKGFLINVLKSPILTFKVAKNTRYYEAQTFYDEIMSKLNESEGLTFFAHNKGVSNVLNNAISKESVMRWICGMYYFNLNFIDEVENRLCADFLGTFFGSYLMTGENVSSKNKLWYAGTFYWLNSGRLLKYCERENIKLPKISDREYAEWLPGEIMDWGNGNKLSSHNKMLLFDNDMYRNTISVNDFLCANENEKRELNQLFDYATKGISYKKYTVLTYNFNNYEIMREIKNKQKDVEYIYVTDNENLKSDTWTVVYDEKLNGLTPFEKVMQVRQNLFKYATTTICIWIDASIEVCGSLNGFIDTFQSKNCDLAVMIHPERHRFEDEYEQWKKTRALLDNEPSLVLSYMNENGYDLNYKGLYEIGFGIARNNAEILNLWQDYSQLIKYFKEDKGVNIRVDQIIFSYILNSKYDYLRVLPMSHECIQNESTLCCMEHNSNDYTCMVRDIPEKGYLFNEEIDLFKI